MRRIIIIVVALLVGSLAVPLSFQEAALRHLRSTTVSAVRFAAQQDPSQLTQLPVSKWTEEPGLQPPQLRQHGWEQFELRIPRASTTVIAHVDLRQRGLSFLLGLGGWLRVIVCMAVSAALLYIGLVWDHRRRPLSKSAARDARVETVSDAENGALVLVQSSLQRVMVPAVILNCHHHICSWNDAFAEECPGGVLRPGLHLLDVIPQLAWGPQLLEAVDAQAQHTMHPYLLIIKEGESICITAG